MLFWKPFPLGLLLLFLQGARCCGEIEWKATHLQKSALAGDAPIHFTYDFINRGRQPVTVVAIRPACGCTTAESSKKTYAAGEAGSIEVVFEVGARVGKQEKTIEVETDDPSSKTVTLVFSADIAELLKAAPRLAIWRVGEANETKSIQLSSAAGLPVTKLDLAADSALVSAEAAPTASKQSFLIRVKPNSTAAMATIPVKCTAHFEGHSPAEITLFVLVK